MKLRFKPYTVDEHDIKDWNPAFLLLMPLSFLFLLILVGGIVIGHYELGQEGATISNWHDAFWMAWMAASTVGFGDVYPITVGGRNAVSVVSGLGICTFGAIGTFVSLWGFARFDTEVQNRVLRAQNAEIIESNNQCVEYLKEVIRTNNLAIEVGERNEILNKEIVVTNQEAIEGNANILTAVISRDGVWN